MSNRIQGDPRRQSLAMHTTHVEANCDATNLLTFNETERISVPLDPDLSFEYSRPWPIYLGLQVAFWDYHLPPNLTTPRQRIKLQLTDSSAQLAVFEEY